MVGSTSKVKSFEIDKRLVHEAWMKVQANGGAPGVDAVSIDGFRQGGEGQPLQAVEPDELRQLSAGPGAGGGDTEGSWGGDQGVGCAQCGRPNRPDRGGDAAGGEAGADLSPRQLRLPSWAFGPRRGGRDSTALLETGLGVGP